MKPSFLILAAAMVMLLAVSVWWVARATVPRVLGRAVAPDGTEMCVVQEFNWSPEPFTTSFVVRKPPGRWGRFYYDHQDNYWGQSKAILDPTTQTAVFYRDGAPAVTFGWATSTCTLNLRKRVETGQACEMPVSWTPTESVWKR